MGHSVSEHRHSTYVPGCYRCDLSKDEARDALSDEVFDLTTALDAIRAVADEYAANGPADVSLGDVLWAPQAMDRIRTILDAA